MVRALLMWTDSRGRWRGSRAVVGLVVMLCVIVALASGPIAYAGTGAETSAAGPADAVEALVVDGDPITSLVPAPPDARSRFAVGGRGFYRSDDGGATWTLTGPLPPPGRVISARDDPRLVLVGDHPPCQSTREAAPVERSEDGGATWHPTAGLGLRPVVVWADTPLALGIGCARFSASTDGGFTWREAPLPDDHPIVTGLDVTSVAVIERADGVEPTPDAVQRSLREVLVVGTSEGGTSSLFRVDFSDSASAHSSDALTEFWGLGALAAQADVYVVGVANGVRVSTDAGVTWTTSRTGLEDVTISVDPSQEFIPDAELTRGFGIRAVAIDPEEPDRLYAGTIRGLYVSSDAGATWQRATGVEGDVTELVFATEVDRLFVDTQDGVVAVPLAGIVTT